MRARILICQVIVDPAANNADGSSPIKVFVSDIQIMHIFQGLLGDIMISFSFFVFIIMSCILNGTALGAWLLRNPLIFLVHWQHNMLGCDLIIDNFSLPISNRPKICLCNIKHFDELCPQSGADAEFQRVQNAGIFFTAGLGC